MSNEKWPYPGQNEEEKMEKNKLIKAVMEGKHRKENWQSFMNQDLSEADLENIDMSYAELFGSSFKGSNLEGANFEGAKASRVDFRKAKLTQSNFSSAFLKGADFTGARFSTDKELSSDKLRDPFRDKELLMTKQTAEWLKSMGAVVDRESMVERVIELEVALEKTLEAINKLPYSAFGKEETDRIFNTLNDWRNLCLPDSSGVRGYIRQHKDEEQK